MLEGLPQNVCQCTHWGTFLKGSIHARDANGREETVSTGRFIDHLNAKLTT